MRASLRRFASFSAAVSLSTTALLAQPLVAYGRVVPRDGAFALACPDVGLTGSSSELQRLVGKPVRLVGTSAGTMLEPRIAVESVAQADDFFELSGSRRIGGDLRFKIVSPTGRIYYFLLAPTPGFTPLDAVLPGISGTFYLGIDSFVILASGAFVSAWEVRVPVPMVPSLVGLRLWTQAAMIAAPGTAVYLNAECTTLGG